MEGTSQLHIGHVIFRLDFGGLENGLVNLINNLPTDRYRHTIICIDGFTEFSERIRRDDVEIIAIRKKPGFDLKAILRLFRTFRRLKPDIVHTRNIAALDALLPAVAAGVPVRIHSEHGWGVADVGRVNKKHRFLRRLHAPLVTRFIALSTEIARYLESEIGVSGSKIAHVYNGVDTDSFSPAQSKEKARTEIGFPFEPDSLVIGTIGRLSPVKNQALLIDAVHLLHEKMPDVASDVRLVIVGSGDSRDDLEKRLELNDLRESTWMAGSTDNVVTFLRSFDVFVLPSLAEGISNTILEAMSVALPVVATDVGGNAELVTNRTTGFLVESASSNEMADALSKYLLDRHLIERHGKAGRDRVLKKFALTRMLDGYMAVYDGRQSSELGNTKETVRSVTALKK